MYIACPFGLKVTNHPRTEQNFLSCYSYSHPKRIVTIEARARNWCYTKFENGATCPSTVVVQSITKTVGRSMAVENQHSAWKFLQRGCANDWPQLLLPDFSLLPSMALFSHAWSLDHNSLCPTF
jgi:hypothetical protein